MKNLIILGAGLTGLSTAYHLERSKKSKYLILEKESRTGGLCKSEKKEGFTFDYAGHLLHLSNKYVKQLVIRLLRGNIRKMKRNSWIYSKGIYTKYPFQVNLYGLPVEVIKDCLIGFIEAKYEKTKIIPKNFEEWIYKYLGRGIAKHFMIPYNKKLWKTHPRKMSCEWLKNYVPTPSLEDVLEGALQYSKKNYGYNTYFYYPISGGIESLPRSFTSKIKSKCLQLNKKIDKINISKKKIFLENGEEKSYEILISTIPLPELLKLIEELPQNIKNISKNLNCTSVYNLNFGINRNQISDKHWIYFPEKDFIFYRVGFPSNYSPNMSPKKMSSVSVEISYPKGETINEKNILDKTIKGLIECGILRPNDNIVTIHALNIKYAYVVYDHNYSRIIKKIKNYLESNKIYSIGRYGSWEYSSMEDAILSGKEIIDKICRGIII